MGSRDPRFDAYIAKAAGFAQPILTHLREVIHSTLPDVEETMKWSSPHFMHKGMLCGLASFKEHCIFRFWKESLIQGPDGGGPEMVVRLARITSLADLPSDDVIAEYLREAARLNDEGVKVVKTPKPGAKKDLVVPDEMNAALDASPQARTVFDGFSPGKRKEYVEWITEAKTDATRTRRLATAVEWIAEGKARNWKYEKC